MKKKVFSGPCTNAKGRNTGKNFDFYSAGRLFHVDQHLYQPYCGCTVILSRAEYVTGNSSLCSVDAPIIATGLAFSVAALFHNIGLFVLKCVFYPFFALSSICSRYSADVCQFTTTLSCFHRVLIFFRQAFSRPFLFTTVVNGVFLDVCLCYRHQDSTYSIACDMLHDHIFQQKN